MRWRKRDLWKAGVVVGGVLLLLVLMILIPVSAVVAHEGVSGSATLASVTVQATPTEDATMTALQKEQLVLQNKQLQQSDDRGFSAWLWSNAAAIVASLLSTLVVVIGALIGFRQWRTNRNDTLTKESNDRKEAQDKELRERAEERFKTAVTALGSDNEATQLGGAILLQSFLNEGDVAIYGHYYSQIFDLAVAYLRLSNTSHSPEGLDSPLPLTPLRQALVSVFKIVSSRAQDLFEESSRYLDASFIHLVPVKK